MAKNLLNLTLKGHIKSDMSSIKSPYFLNKPLNHANTNLSLKDLIHWSRKNIDSMSGVINRDKNCPDFQNLSRF